MRKLASLMVALLVLVGCGTQLGGTGRVEVLLTDAPAAEAETLVVSFGRIDLVPHEDDEEGIRTVNDSIGEIDVLSLQNGATELLGAIELETGSYHQIRLIVEDAQVDFGGGDVYPVTIPSGAQTGLKINVEPALIVEGGATSQVMLDFDASRAVIETPPGSSNYLLKPTGIRAVTVSGTLTGAVVDAESTNPVSAATVEVYADGDTVSTTTAITSEAGTFRIITLQEGSYDVVVTAEGYQDLTVDDVTVTAGETTDLGELALEAEATLEPSE